MDRLCAAHHEGREFFSVRPSVAVSAQGAPVVAWEESDALWGKDFTFLFDRRGTAIYTTRRVRLATLEGADWKGNFRHPCESMPADLRRYQQQPQLAMDESGHLYLAFRSRTRIRGNGTHRLLVEQWALGETFLTHLDGDRWTPGNHDAVERGPQQYARGARYATRRARAHRLAGRQPHLAGGEV